MSSFVLKMIGIISMLLDHIGYAFYGHSILRIIGRLAFPIFAFQAVIGYEHTKNLKKHFFKLLVFAIISEIPFYLLTSITTKTISLNVMFTILLGLFTIELFKKASNKFDGFLIVTLMCIFAQLLNVDYRWFGILTIFFFYYYRDNKVKCLISYALINAAYYLINLVSLEWFYLYCFISAMFAFILIRFYNNQEGRKTKYLFYLFYPAHMLVIYLVHLIIKG